MKTRFMSKSGNYIALIHADSFSVIVTSWGVSSFNNSWPGSQFSGDNPIRFDYESNGDLAGVSTSIDGAEVLALSEDAQAFGEKMRAKYEKNPPVQNAKSC